MKVGGGREDFLFFICNAHRNVRDILSEKCVTTHILGFNHLKDMP